MIPPEFSYVPSLPSPPISLSSSSFSSSNAKSTSFSSTGETADVKRVTPRHVEIKNPNYGPALMKESHLEALQQPTQPSTDGLRVAPSSFDMAQPIPDFSRANTMDSTISGSLPERPMSSHSANGSAVQLNSAYSSQVSLIDTRAEYDSASEAESTKQDNPSESDPTLRSQAQTTIQRPAQTVSTANLSGLVCNVHRTTGKEPHALVGATTTILGDKLYVFGGRRLSRISPQLTSSLYELDLTQRHWSKIHAKGDIPAPRYFHSVCALGDTKLVCYGGMSPAPGVEASSETKAEVVVMSDIHIYDVMTRTWTKVLTQEIPQGRYAHCAAILPSSAVFASPRAPMSAVHHNPSSGHPNQGSLGVALDGTGGAEMVVVGGQDSTNHYIEQISVFNLRSLTWTNTLEMGRSCGAYRSVVTPLTTMSAAEIGAGPQSRHQPDDEYNEPEVIGSGAPMLIYSNYNFLDVKLELQVRMTDGTLIERPMHTTVSPPGLRFPNGGVIDNHFVVSGTFLTSSKQEYALWALDLRTLTWNRIDAGGSIFSQGSWNRGVLWNRRNAFVVLGNRRRNLADDYNNRRINFSNICIVELEAFGLYENPPTVEPTSGYVSASAALSHPNPEFAKLGNLASSAAEDIGARALNLRELADMEFIALDGTRVPVNSRLVARQWGPHFITMLRESLASATETDTATLRPSLSGPNRNSSITITPSVNSMATTLTNNSTNLNLPDIKTAPPQLRPRLLYLPHTTPTLQALLHYLYTSRLPEAPHHLATPQIFCSLLQLARPYKIDGLLEAVVERLHDCLDGRNAAAIFNASAMAAGGGDSVQIAANGRTIRESEIPVRTASLAGMDTLAPNGSARGATTLRVDTDMANGRNTRNTLRPGQFATLSEDTDGEEPAGAVTDNSTSESDLSSNEGSLASHSGKEREIWHGAMSSVVGLQKRGLRGLMEGRRMRERGKGESVNGAKVGLGIA